MGVNNCNSPLNIIQAMMQKTHADHRYVTLEIEKRTRQFLRNKSGNENE